MHRSTVAFDFDSTLIDLETLDALIELALAGLDPQIRSQRLSDVRTITDLGMNGEISLVESLARRMKLATITRREINHFRQMSVRHITAGIEPIIHALRATGHRVLIVSGGFTECIQPVAAALGLHETDIVANTLTYDDEGRVTGVLEPSPLMNADGKSIVLRKQPTERRLMIGDGRTDVQAFESGAATDFIGFALHAARPYILQHAPRHCRTIEEFRSHLVELQYLSAS